MKDASQQTKPEIWAGALTQPSREAADRGNLEGGTTSNSAETLPVGRGRGRAPTLPVPKVPPDKSCKTQDALAAEPQMAGITERPGLLSMLPSSHGQGSHTLGDTETRWCHCMRIRNESPDCAVGHTGVLYHSQYKRVTFPTCNRPLPPSSPGLPLPPQLRGDVGVREPLLLPAGANRDPPAVCEVPHGPAAPLPWRAPLFRADRGPGAPATHS